MFGVKASLSRSMEAQIESVGQSEHATRTRKTSDRAINLSRHTDRFSADVTYIS